jgi:hypothetical protein
MGQTLKYDKKNLNGWALPEEAIEWIYNNIPEGSTILELGSGNGTKELVKRYKVYSVEENKKWLELVPETTYIYGSIKSYKNDKPHTRGWFDDSVIEKFPEKYDLLIIDGPTGNNRVNFLNFYEHFRNDVPIVIDDTQRGGDKLMAIEVSKLMNKKILEIKGHEKEMMILL